MKKTIKPIIGIIALACAAIGLILAVFGADIAESIEPTPPIEEKVADLTVKIKDAVVAKLKDRDALIESEELGFSWHTTIPKAGMALAVLGLIGGAMSYTRGENRAFAISAGGIGVVALAWQALMISLGAILLIVIVFIVLNSLGLDLSF
ncbi:hypothetical protein N9A86_04470 [Akkermansiaceae bacterium]|nr:hypothetical protein [Akkermansiaceae bacterium]MDB4537899.1 hypothetical protein [Akkermansiaceae bacterium]